MKKLLPIFLLVFSLQALAEDTIVFDKAVELETNLSSYDSVVVKAINTITLKPGFSYSSGSTNSFHTEFVTWNAEEPEQTLTPGTTVGEDSDLDGGYLVGTIPGQPGVSPSGAATYAIPLVVPPGTNGIVPQLSINYNSQSGNGLLGRGWNLGGISSIVATGKTRYYDNESTAISTIDTACRVVWDGQRLLALNKAGLEADSFRTEMVTNVKITTTGSGNSMWFTVKMPDGRTMEYGNATDSRLVLGDSTQLKWMLNKMYDRNGNTIEYTYTKDESVGEILLNEVNYGGPSTSLVNTVSFHYTTRADISYAYIHNDLVLYNKLLDSITMQSSSSYYGSYGFAFSPSTGESLLDEIVQYDKDNNRYNATKTNWEAPTFTLSPTPTIITSDNEDIDLYRTGDFDGDGYTDLVRIKLDYTDDSLMYFVQRGSANGLDNSVIEGNLPRSYTHQFWSIFTDRISLPGGCNYSGPPALQTSLSSPDISYVLSGDFDGDGKDELFVKVMEWEDLLDYLPDDLDNGFDSIFYTDYGGFLDNSVLCPKIPFFTGTGQTINGAIGYILNLDKSDTSQDWKQSFRLGDSHVYDNQYTAMPDLEGRGYSTFPFDHSMAYYDPKSDTVFEVCDISSGDTRWCELNGDRKADYIEPHNTTFNLYTYQPSTNTYTSTQENGYFLGTIDLNGDGISAWVALGSEEDETVSYATVWGEYGCVYTNSACWEDFLSDNNIFSSYESYENSNCSGDNADCRSDFIDAGGMITRSIGRELFIEHNDDNSPKISLGHYMETHSLPDDPLFTRAVSADIDGDGKNDLLLLSEDTLKTVIYDFTSAYSNGNLSYDYESIDMDEALSDNMVMGDFNGDGILEFVFPDEEEQLCFVTSGKPGKTLSSITNGLGIKTRFTFKPLTDNSVYTRKSNASFPVVDLAAPWYVVSSLSTDNGVASDATSQYQYQGGKVHIQGKGFLGFIRSTAENTLLNQSVIRTSEYETSFFQTYPDSLISYAGDSLVSSRKSYFNLDSLGLRKFQIFTDSVVSYNNLKGITISTEMNYNSNGTLSEKYTKYDSDAVIKDRYNYTSAGWHVASYPSSMTRVYTRGLNSTSDSTTIAYNSNGNTIQKKDFCGTDRELTSRYSDFDSYGNARRFSMSGKRGQDLTTDSVCTTYSYSADGRFLLSQNAPLNNNEFYNYAESAGTLVSKTSVNDRVIDYEYGPFNNLKTITQPNYIENTALLSWVDGQEEIAPADAQFYRWSAVSGSPEVLTFYDEAGRELRTVSKGFDDTKNIFVTTEYDTLGRLYRKSLPYYPNDTIRWTSYTYDTNGQVRTETQPNGNVATYSYNGLETSAVLTNGSKSFESKTQVNALGEVVESEDDLGNVINNNYYPEGRLKESYSNRHTSEKITFSYDAQGNRTTLSDPDAGIISSSYDAFGNLLQQINAKGDTSTFVYDDLGRVTRQTDERGDIFYSYISDTISTAFGMVDSVYNTDQSLMQFYQYDSQFGRLSSLTKVQTGKTFTNTYTYDPWGRPVTRIYPTGFEVEYDYTNQGDLQSVSSNGLTIWSCSDVNALGQITTYSQGSYSSTTTFDYQGQLTNVTTPSIVNMNYSYDDFGNISSREDGSTNQKEEFTYDKLNRLESIEYYLNGSHISSEDISMGYDNCGNIVSKTGLSTDIDYGEGTVGPHALTTINSPDASYIPVPQTINYNCFNKVSSITDTLSGGTPLNISFEYGLGNQRIKTSNTRDGIVERVKYFDMDYEEDSTSASVKKYHYIHGGNGLCAIFVKQGTSNDTMFYVFPDNLGSITTIVNASNSAVKNYSFNAWGIPRDSDDWTSDFSGTLFANRGFTGHEHLSEVSLINMNGRIFDPFTSRFLSPDPFIQAPSFPNSYNRYSYALNNPLRFTDPTGYLTTAEYNNIVRNLMNSPDGGSWNEHNGISYYGGYAASISAGQGYLGAFGGGGGSFSVTGSLGGFVRTYLPGKQRYGYIWEKGDLRINFPTANTGWESSSSLSTPLTPVAWLNEPIDDIFGEAASRVSMNGNDIISSYPHGYSIAAFEGNSGELRQWNPSGVHRWSRSSNFFASLSYDLVNGISVTAQSFLRGPNSVHLTGELVKGNDRVDAFVNTASWALLAAEASTFNTTKTGIGVYSTRWRLRVQFHRHGISPLKGRGATGKMYPFHLNINNTHIIFNPKYWKYFY